MTTNAQVTQIPAKPPPPPPPSAVTAPLPASSSSSVYASSTVSSNMTEPSAANQSLLQSIPMGVSSGIITSDGIPRVEAEGMINEQFSLWKGLFKVV